MEKFVLFFENLDRVFTLASSALWSFIRFLWGIAGILSAVVGIIIAFLVFRFVIGLGDPPSDLFLLFWQQMR